MPLEAPEDSNRSPLEVFLHWTIWTSCRGLNMGDLSVLSGVGVLHNTHLLGCVD